MQKIVEKLEWKEGKDVLLFRQVFSDRTVGKWTPAGFASNDLCYREKVRRVAIEEIGKKSTLKMSVG